MSVNVDPGGGSGPSEGGSGPSDGDVVTLRFQRKTLAAPSSRVEVKFAGPMEVLTGNSGGKKGPRTYRGRVQLLPSNLKLRGPAPVTVTNLTGNALFTKPGDVKIFVSGPGGGEEKKVTLDPGNATTITSPAGDTEPGTGPNYPGDDGDQPGTGVNFPGVGGVGGGGGGGDDGDSGDGGAGAPTPTPGDEPPDSDGDGGGPSIPFLGGGGDVTGFVRGLFLVLFLGLVVRLLGLFLGD